MLRLASRVSFLAALPFGWLAVAAALWQTDVPADLRLPALDPLDYFSASELARAADYARFTNVNGVLAMVVLLVTLGAYTRFGTRYARDSAAGPIGTGMYLAMIGVALVWLAQAPFAVAQVWWDRRHGMADVDYLGWAVASWMELAVTCLVVCPGILVVMGLARFLGHRWWILGGPVFVAIALGLAFVSPFLAPTEDVDAYPTARAAYAIAQVHGAPDIPVRVADMRDVTEGPNAYAAGLGPTRQVVLWSTLVDERFEAAEVAAVLAHEYAHHTQQHLLKSIGWYALFALPAAFALAAATRRRGSLRTPAAVPLLLFVLVCLQTVALPVQNAASRRMEAEADWIALESTRDPAAARSLEVKLARAAHDDPRRPAWAQALTGTHPTAMERIAMVDAWAQRNGDG